jgi:ComF family protein
VQAKYNQIKPMIRLAHDFLSLIFPLRCCVCAGARLRQEPFICSSCLIKLPRELNYNGLNNNTAQRLSGMMKFDSAFSFLRFSKQSKVQQLLHLVKYRNEVGLGIQLGKWFAAEILYHRRDLFDLIVPVPLHPQRLKDRGYNQSLAVAQGISQITGHQVSEALNREPTERTQTDLDRWQRFENTTNEFRLALPRDIVNKHILLIDDVITTGATMVGSSKPLVEGGVAGIVVGSVGLTQER